MFISNRHHPLAPPLSVTISYRVNLSHSHYFVRTSDISGLSSVERLTFKDYNNLTEIHQSIGKLSNLIYLDLENCRNPGYLPKEIFDEGKGEIKKRKVRVRRKQERRNSSAGRNPREENPPPLPSTLSRARDIDENVNLYLCSNLKELPEDVGNMESLKELNIACTAIKNLSISISHLKNLTNFLWNNERSLIESPDTSFSGDLGGLPNFEMFFLKGNTFHCLPTCLSHLPKLKVA
ncbi:hypothetical protein SLEP1_g20175 [Rubroshorea leprosula]|uniref:Uncharacterized protein n=1 Tax=Rubroshorea leprosula TaxID=152421 RepID=A0AAV5J544_9ROSI|nr:hypothetical protein SLEP1_g20175 [Rubroshorea leprosula]